MCQVLTHLVTDLVFVQVPRVLSLGTGTRRRVRGTGDAVDLRLGLNDLVRQLLSRRQDLRVVLSNQVLQQLLQLLSVQLQQRLCSSDVGRKEGTRQRVMSCSGSDGLSRRTTDTEGWKGNQESLDSPILLFRSLLSLGTGLVLACRATLQQQSCRLITVI